MFTDLKLKIKTVKVELNEADGSINTDDGDIQLRTRNFGSFAQVGTA